ncbi:polysaccharide biosynthesis tyrosine autokinase [bacterium]|nr:MAG: polysaccharide biosynthesis tyrosine autokinase [bacterium]
MPQYELNLRDYLRIFRKRKVTIIVTFILATGLSMFYLSGQPVVYQSSSTVKIEERKTIAGLLTEEIVFNPADVMESETKIIKGYSVMKMVAFRVGKINEKTPIEELNSIVAGLQSGIETERIGGTNMIRITATAATPKEAMDLANITAQVYIEESLLEKAKEARHARQFIEEQLVSSDKRLREAEDALGKLGNNVKNIRLAEPIQNRLMELEFNLAELLQKYTEKHPRVIQLREQIKDLEKQLKEFSGQDLEYARLNREVEVNQKLYGMLKEKLEEARISEAQKVSDVSMVDPAPPGEPLSGNKHMGMFAGGVLGLILGVALAFVLETLDTSIGTIEDVENVVKLSVLGVVPPIESEFGTKHTLFSRIRERIMPIPKTEEEEKFSRLVSHYKPQSSIAEAYRNIHTNLKIDSFRKAILVTSSGPQEGKSSVVCNLGIVMAQAGLRVVLVSADLRRPVLVKTFGIGKEPGLVEFITGSATLDESLKSITDIMLGEIKFEEILKTPGIENIWIMPSGRFTANPVELLESKKIPILVEELKNRFDVAIFDAPPVLPVTDSSILAPLVDATVIVYEIGRTSREALIRTKIQIESTGAKISGVILNHTKLETEAVTSYPYSKYKYYSVEKEGKGRFKKSIDKKEGFL